MIDGDLMNINEAVLRELLTPVVSSEEKFWTLFSPGIAVLGVAPSLGSTHIVLKKKIKKRPESGLQS